MNFSDIWYPPFVSVYLTRYFICKLAKTVLRTAQAITWKVTYHHQLQSLSSLSYSICIQAEMKGSTERGIQAVLVKDRPNFTWKSKIRWIRWIRRRKKFWSVINTRARAIQEHVNQINRCPPPMIQIINKSRQFSIFDWQDHWRNNFRSSSSSTV